MDPKDRREEPENPPSVGLAMLGGQAGSAQVLTDGPCAQFVIVDVAGSAWPQDALLHFFSAFSAPLLSALETALPVAPSCLPSGI